jgi:recombination protein RecA
MKIGVMYGSPETTTGDNALKFCASVRFDIRRSGAIKDLDEICHYASDTRLPSGPPFSPPFVGAPPLDRGPEEPQSSEAAPGIQ